MIQFHKIQDGLTRPRSQTGLGSVHRAIPACGGRANSTPTSIAAFKRSKVAKALRNVLLASLALLIDALFMGAAPLLVSSAAVAIVGGIFILLFVGT